MEIIKKQLTLDYWEESGWFEGRLREIPDLLSQGQTIEELEDHLREDCAALVSDVEFAKSRGYGHLDAADIWNAELKRVKLDRFQAAVAQLQTLSPDRSEKVFAYIEDLVDLEALERRADEEDARREQEEGDSENDWQ
jgi:predicted RNase H-like HicB family nuclease